MRFRLQQFAWLIFIFPRARARLARWHHPVVHLLRALRDVDLAREHHGRVLDVCQSLQCGRHWLCAFRAIRM